MEVARKRQPRRQRRRRKSELFVIFHFVAYCDNTLHSSGGFHACCQQLAYERLKPPSSAVVQTVTITFEEVSRTLLYG
jgi:hypothetical protein